MKKKNSYWNYRMLKTDTGIIDGKQLSNYSIIEVYYDTNDKITGYSDHMYAYGETEKELKIDISMMLKACRYPALTLEDLNFKKNKNVKSNLEK